MSRVSAFAAPCSIVWLLVSLAAADPVLRAPQDRRWGHRPARDQPAVQTEIAPNAATIDSLLGSPELGPDVLVNDRSLSSCPCSNGRPSTQSETSVAALGSHVLVSWNERRGNCTGGDAPGRQSHGWSVDHGTTFRTGASLNFPPVTGLRGDPTVAVNAATGRWYVSGLQASGVAVVRGSFSGADFVLDAARSLQPPAGVGYDKPWMAVDALSGNVYLTWTRFPADGSSEIVLQRLDADLNPLGPIQTLRTTPPYTVAVDGVQGGYVAVGPDGELYVGWYRYTFAALGRAPSFLEIVRSNDSGQTFGPVQVIAENRWAGEAVPTAFQRGFWPSIFAFAVDTSPGPYRGRVYATWSEIVDLSNLVLGGGATVQEVENNDFFASATPFAPGDVVRGSIPAAGNDFYRFHGTKGQVFAAAYDSLPVNADITVRLLCPRDTAGTASYHAITIGGQISGLPYDGEYYLQIEALSGGSGNYQISTGLAPTPGPRARDIRDQFLAWSDDGVTWSTPVRLNDDAPGSDGIWPQVAVDGRGRVHASWFDWRDDVVCGVRSEQYMTSSGDGGVTWGPNRKITDQSSFWGLLASCLPNNLGDYSHMAAAGDYVYASFGDARFGDPDAVVDVSRFGSEQTCPADRSQRPGSPTTLDFTLANRGNFATPLAWRVGDSAGWLTGVTPTLDGSQILAPNESVVIRATVVPPDSCSVDSTFVRFVTHDPNVPGLEDTCVTVVRCDPLTPILPALRSVNVQGRDVSLRWYGSGLSGAWANVARRTAGGEWTTLGRIRADALGGFSFTDRGVAPGAHVYRLAGERADFVVETAVDVPALALAIERTWSEDFGIEVAFVLPTSRPAVLELIDVAGRLWARDELRLEPGARQHRIASRRLPGGVYLVRLTQDGAAVSTKAIAAN